MTNVLLRRAALALALTTVLAACGKDEAPAPADEAQPAPTASVAAPASNDGRGDTAPAAAGEAPLAASDLDAYARGMQQEVTLLKAAGDKVAQARSQNDKDAEASAMMEMANLDAGTEGAKAAGLAPARYEFVKGKVDEALGKLEMQASLASMGGQGEGDAGRAEMASTVGDPFQGMAADVAAAFKARQQELAQLRAQAIAARFDAAR